ncbi:MAG: Anaerobic sulfatase-maturating enzyme [Syntrophomonadaceae bacterium]|nr:Anaerobic sulfatase-maturating enzyme [Bacillota bacterium]
MSKRFRNSLFVYKYEKEDHVCLFHAVHLKKLYGVGVLSNIYEFFQNPNFLSDFALDTHEYNSENLEPTFKKLVELGYLVPEDYDDKNQLLNLKGKLLTKSEPVCLYLLVASDCNLDCIYCCVGHNKPPSYINKQMSVVTAIEGVDDFFSESTDPRYIAFFGGEPLTNFPVIREVVEYVKNKYKFDHFKINTNGTLITDEVADFFSKYNFTIGVSIDGPQEIHDKFRMYKSGSGSHSKTMKGWWKLKEHGCKDVGIVAVLHADNARRIRDVLDYFITLEPCAINFELVESIPNEILEDFRPSPHEAASALIHNFEMVESTMQVRDNIVSNYLYNFINEEPSIYRCASHWGARIIDSHGVPVPCFNFLSNDQINYNYEKSMSEWRKRSPITMKDCQRCPAICICGGICAAHSKAHSGSIWGTDQEYSCSIIRLILEWMIWDLKERYERQQPNNNMSAKDIEHPVA